MSIVGEIHGETSLQPYPLDTACTQTFCAMAASVTSVDRGSLRASPRMSARRSLISRYASTAAWFR